MSGMAYSFLFDDDSDDEFIMNSKQYKVRPDFLDTYDDSSFIKRFRLSKESAFKVLEEIEDELEYSSDRNDSLSPMLQLLVALRFYATGSFYLTLADCAGIAASSVCRTVGRVSRAIASLKNKYICFPATDDEIASEMLRNYTVAHFPKVIGMIDCTHIRISSPGGNDAEYFRNRKGYFSLNVQVIGNENLLIKDLVARWPGSAHDSTVFGACHRRAMFEDGRYGDNVLIGDTGYPTLPFLMTPLENPTTREEELFNESLIRTRNCIERLFGVWKRRFPVLALGFRTKLKHTMPIITATAVLHNILRLENEEVPPDDPDLELPRTWNDLLVDGQITNSFNGNLDSQGEIVRNSFITSYFKRLLGNPS